MMIFFRERLAFLAVPKTGTSAMERALGSKASAVFRDPPGVKHTNARGFEKKVRKIFERGDLAPIETMAIIREPIDWLGSWYRYRQRPALKGRPNSTAEVSFDQFVEAYLSDTPPPFAQVGRQSRFVTDGNEDLLVNHLFSYEKLTQAVEFLEHRLNTTVALKSVNESAKKQIALSDELRAEVRRVCSLDFEIYNALSEGPLSIP